MCIRDRSYPGTGQITDIFFLFFHGPSPLPLKKSVCNINAVRLKLLVPLATIFFGLIHGLGFASSISEVGLPQDKLLPIILSFNLGVEIGQLLVAFAILGFLMLARHYLSNSHFNSIHNIAGTVVFSMGTFWFVTRAVGI